MNKVYSLKYSNVSSLFSDIFISKHIGNSNKDISTNSISIDDSIIENALDEFISKDYDIVFRNLVAISAKKGNIYLYILSGDVKTLYCIFNRHNIELTEIAIEQLKTIDNFKSYLVEIYLGIILVSTLINSFDELKRTRQVKTIKEKFSTQYKIKDCKIKISEYDKTEDINYIISNDNNKVNFLVNNYEKTKITVPSMLYKLPNKSNISTFSKDNTFELENDDISKVLSEITFIPGKCYENSEKIVNAIKNAGLHYKVDYYTGWLYNSGDMTHHSWVIVDDKHLIDATFFRDDTIQSEHIEKSEKGEIYEINREIISNKIISLMNSDKEFKDKYGYGKVIHDYLYIGVKSNRNETRNSVSLLLRKNPNHPSFINTDNQGRSKTIAMIEGKMK